MTEQPSIDASDEDWKEYWDLCSIDGIFSAIKIFISRADQTGKVNRTLLKRMVESQRALLRLMDKYIINGQTALMNQGPQEN